MIFEGIYYPCGNGISILLIWCEFMVIKLLGNTVLVPWIRVGMWMNLFGHWSLDGDHQRRHACDLTRPISPNFGSLFWFRKFAIISQENLGR